MLAYLAAVDREDDLLAELDHAGSRVLERFDRLVLADVGPRRTAWASNVWLEPERVSFDSISHATEILRARHPSWALYGTRLHRRAALIQAGLPPVEQAPLAFGTRPPNAPLGSWTLLDPQTLLLSARCSSPFPNGEIRFVEDRAAPPSRAYLKLWELFTRTGTRPRPGEICLDLGSSPGGWTWVLAKLGARVISVDKAPLDERVARLPGVRFEQRSAFSIDPEHHPPVDWLFSDVICYPERLYETVQRWIASGKVRHLVCTLKFQGQTDHEITRRFARIPGSRLLHLHHNKHELTWVRAGQPR